ncbi:hypothetical protein P3S67_015583 [Capsicum chacoense]
MVMVMKFKESGVDKDEDVDIIGGEKDSTFSDFDMSGDEIFFLPVDPIPDALEPQVKCVGSSSKLGESKQSGSPSSDGAGQNGQVKHESSPFEGEDAGTIKRK